MDCADKGDKSATIIAISKKGIPASFVDESIQNAWSYGEVASEGIRSLGVSVTMHVGFTEVVVGFGCLGRGRVAIGDCPELIQGIGKDPSEVVDAPLTEQSSSLNGWICGGVKGGGVF